MPDGYVEVTIGADAPLAENLSAILSQLGFEGFWEEEGALHGYISATRWSDSFLEEVRSVVGLIARSSRSPSPAIEVRGIPLQNWNAEWEKTITPIRVTDGIVIAPSWHQPEAGAGGVVLTIDPKMSFGTGYHETTRLMLRLLEHRVRPGSSVLDVGTGTGVLAIAALRLGAHRAVGCDIDPWSIENARENGKVNGVADRLTIIEGEISAVAREPHDLVLANIQLNVIGPILGEIRERCAPGGAILLAGLLLQDEEEIRSLLRSHRLEVDERRSENEWVAFALHPG
jgi:ribosomal protein L11 methyltransferase